METEDTNSNLGFLVYVVFIAYCLVWAIVALSSGHPAWWFTPIYGTIKIFQESVWRGLLDVSALPVLLLVGAAMDRD